MEKGNGITPPKKNMTTKCNEREKNMKADEGKIK